MRKNYIITSSLLACLLLYFIEQVIQVNYLTKTLAKILLFTIIPYIYIKYIKNSTFKEFLSCKKLDKGHFKIGFAFGAAAFLIVLSAYFILKSNVDIPAIVEELKNKSKITPGNFLLVGAYITFGNSFLEEFFFRGFIFLNLYELGFKKRAYICSSLLFGLYHIAIFKTWFNPWLIALALFGLISVGFIFDWLDTKSENFINSWIVHIMADSAIILIGVWMFGMI